MTGFSEVFDQAIIRHVRRLSAGEEAAHVLCPSAYDCRYAEMVIRRHFPTLEFGGLVNELPSFEANQSKDQFKDPIQSFRPVMVASLSRMCLLYLRARLSAAEVTQFEQAIALAVNYKPFLCCITEAKQPIASLHSDELLSVYKDTTHVNVDFPEVKPRWDFDGDRPIY
jgi:hypothetical protein